eukprot:gene8487-9354_t
MSYHRTNGGRPVRVSTEMIEKNIRQQRDVEKQRLELAAFGKENANLMSVASAQERIEQQRRLAQQQISRNEQLYDEQLKKQQYDTKYRELTILQNQALSNELEKDTADEERKRREIQKICEESPELRDLERMLKIAYLNKERAAQYEEKIAMAMKEQERIQAIEDAMEAERIHSVRQESLKDREKRLQFAQQRALLQEQINEKKLRLQEARQQIERERIMVDDIVNKINQEDESDYRKRKEKQAATAAMVKAYEEQRKRELEAARAAAKAEEDRIAAYNRSMEARNEGIAAKKAAKKEEDDRILNQIIEETERKRKEEEEFNSLRDMLWEEELEAKRAHDAHERQLKVVRMKEDMIRANSEMMKYKELQRLKEMEEETRLVLMMKQKFAEDEAKERAAEESRQRAKVVHMSHIERQKEERRSLYEQERASEQIALREIQEREDYRKKVIQEARKRLLEEHASRLQGYLPNKVFESREEYEQFRPSR